MHTGKIFSKPIPRQKSASATTPTSDGNSINPTAAASVIMADTELLYAGYLPLAIATAIGTTPPAVNPAMK